MQKGSRLGIESSTKSSIGALARPLKNALKQSGTEKLRPPTGTSVSSECGEEDSTNDNSIELDSPTPWDCIEPESPSSLPLPVSGFGNAKLADNLPRSVSPCTLALQILPCGSSSPLPSSPPTTPLPSSRPSSTFKSKKRKDVVPKPCVAKIAAKLTVDINPDILNSRNLCVSNKARYPPRRDLDESTEKQLFEAVGSMVARKATRKGTQHQFMPHNSAETGNTFLTGETSFKISSFVNEYTKSLKAVLFRNRSAKTNSAAFQSVSRIYAATESTDGDVIVHKSHLCRQVLVESTPPENIQVDNAANHQQSLHDAVDDEIPFMQESQLEMLAIARRRHRERLTTFVDHASQPDHVDPAPRSSTPICTTPTIPPSQPDHVKSSIPICTAPTIPPSQPDHVKSSIPICTTPTIPPSQQDHFKSSIPICTTPNIPPSPARHRLGVDLRNVRMQIAQRSQRTGSRLMSRG